MTLCPFLSCQVGVCGLWVELWNGNLGLFRLWKSPPRVLSPAIPQGHHRPVSPGWPWPGWCHPDELLPRPRNLRLPAGTGSGTSVPSLTPPPWKTRDFCAWCRDSSPLPCVRGRTCREGDAAPIVPRSEGTMVTRAIVQGSESAFVPPGTARPRSPSAPIPWDEAGGPCRA